jgi:anthranilate/para-aminobenzoate synthase component II
MILIINICKEEMHYFEFVKPIENILLKAEEPFVTKKYTDVNKKDLDSSHRIIITGTSLKDMSYSNPKNTSKFKFLLSYDKPILAICGGMQLLCIIHGCKLVKGQAIGLHNINFNSEFLGVNGSREVYELHNMAVKDDAVLKKSFNIYAKTEIVDKNKKIDIIQAVKHKHFKHYGVLFHPEVRNKDLIVNFLYA